MINPLTITSLSQGKLYGSKPTLDQLDSRGVIIHEPGLVRRQINCDFGQPDFVEALAHLVWHFRRRLCDAASAAVRWSFV
jgi:hypothetical protein